MSIPSVKLADGRTVKLGRIRPKAIADVGRFRVTVSADDKVSLAPLLMPHFSEDEDKTPPPDATNWRAKCESSIKQTLGNTQQGDCVIAGKLHQIGLWTGNDAGTPVLSSDREALSEYHRICGPGDNGCNISSVLDEMKRNGISCGGERHKIDGYVALDHTNKVMMQVVISLFGGGVSLGINLPQQWTCTDCVWDENARGSVGGHDVPILDYDRDFVYVATWGGVARITWAAFLSKRFIEEAFLSLSPDWYGRDDLAPNGINKETLAHDLALAGGGEVPPLPGPTPVPPGPTPVPPEPDHVITGSFGSDVPKGAYLLVPMTPELVESFRSMAIDWQAFLKILAELIALLAKNMRAAAASK